MKFNRFDDDDEMEYGDRNRHKKDKIRKSRENKQTMLDMYSNNGVVEEKKERKKFVKNTDDNDEKDEKGTRYKSRNYTNKESNNKYRDNKESGSMNGYTSRNKGIKDGYTGGYTGGYGSYNRYNTYNSYDNKNKSSNYNKEDKR